MSKPVQTTGSLVSIKAPNHTTPIQSPQPRLSAWTKKDPLATSGFATDPVPTITTTAPNADSAATALKFRPLVFGTLSNAPTTPNPAILTTAHAAAARSQPVRVNDTSLQRAQSRSREPSTLGPSAESKDSVTMPRSILASQTSTPLYFGSINATDDASAQFSPSPLNAPPIAQNVDAKPTQTDPAPSHGTDPPKQSPNGNEHTPTPPPPYTSTPPTTEAARRKADVNVLFQTGSMAGPAASRNDPLSSTSDLPQQQLNSALMASARMAPNQISQSRMMYHPDVRQKLPRQLIAGRISEYRHSYNPYPGARLAMPPPLPSQQPPRYIPNYVTPYVQSDFPMANPSRKPHLSPPISLPQAVPQAPSAPTLHSRSTLSRAAPPFQPRSTNRGGTPNGGMVDPSPSKMWPIYIVAPPSHSRSASITPSPTPTASRLVTSPETREAPKKPTGRVSVPVHLESEEDREKRLKAKAEGDGRLEIETGKNGTKITGTAMAAKAANAAKGKAKRQVRPAVHNLNASVLNIEALELKQPLQLRDDFVQIFETPSLKSRALGLRHTEAARFNELVHRCLTALPEDDTVQEQILRLLQDVCSESGELPSSYWLERVTVDWRRCVGKGGEALIFKGSLRDRSVVVRQIHSPDSTGWASEAGQEALRYIRREIITHAQLRHPNVIPFLGVFKEEEAPMVILPFMEGGSAMEFLKKLGTTEIGLAIGCILLNVTSALAYLHGKIPPILHGDIHPGNILIDANGKAVLCDFGFSRIRHEATRTHTTIREGGRLRFLAPELSSGPDKFRTSQASDIYSLAMTFLMLVTLALPFPEMDRELEAVRMAEQGIRPKQPERMNIPAGTEDRMWRLLGVMWQQEPKKRPDACGICETLQEIFV